MEARVTTATTARSSSTLSQYQRRHMPPPSSSYNTSTIMPLLDIDLTMTEDSSSLDAPSSVSERSYDRKHIVFRQYEEEEEDEEECYPTRSQTPKTVDLSPSYSSSNSSCLSKRMHNQQSSVCRHNDNSLMWMDVRYCSSHTCLACREPQYPKFLPIEASSTPFFQLNRPLAGTRWWERDYDSDLLASLMRPMLEFLNDNACDMMMDPLDSAFMTTQDSQHVQREQQQQQKQGHHEPMRQTHKLIPPSSFSSLPPRCPRRIPPAEHDAQRISSKKKAKKRRDKKDKHVEVADLPPKVVVQDDSLMFVPFDEV
jgi:hypothetical protein